MFDAAKFLIDHNVPVFHSGSNVQRGWVGIKCPLCSDHSSHGGFNLSGGYYHCWRCGGSSVPWIVMNLLGISYSKAVDLVADYDQDFVRTIEVRRETTVTLKAVGLPGGLLDLQQRKYLLRRGFDPAMLEDKYRIRGTGRTGDLAHRIVIPILFNGQVVAWQARTTIEGVEPRYLSSSTEESILSVKEVLYNLDNCKKRRVIVCEGVTDVWRVGDDCCATFGVAYSQEQRALLCERFDEIFVLFDTGREEFKRASELAALLDGAGKHVEILSEIDAKDPGMMTEQQVEQLKDELGL